MSYVLRNDWENIRLHQPAITPSVVSVARYVNAHQFIDTLPRKYQEPVTERGSTLSAGQRQLIAFARALAYDPAILILDEATANIDTETELLIQDALPKLMAGRTSLVVAHRLSTIQDADSIIVLHKGILREQGTHQELLAQKGLYYNLFYQYKRISKAKRGPREARSGAKLLTLDASGKGDIEDIAPFIQGGFICCLKSPGS